MSGSGFEPWRREGPVNDPLAARVGQRWEALIHQSKLAVASLRQATAEAEQQLQHHGTADAAERSLGAVHERLARRLDEFETRLGRIEKALAEPLASLPMGEKTEPDRPASHKLTLPPQQHAA